MTLDIKPKNLHRYHGSALALGELKGHGSFCHVYGIKSLPRNRSVITTNKLHSKVEKVGLNANWESERSVHSSSSNLSHSSSRETNLSDKYFPLLRIKAIKSLNAEVAHPISTSSKQKVNMGRFNDNKMKLSMQITDSTYKLKDKLLTSASTITESTFLRKINQKNIVAKIPKNSENKKLQLESIEGLRMEAKILSSLSHKNIIRIHGMSGWNEDFTCSDSSLQHCISGGDSEAPPYFILLDCLSCTLDRKIEEWACGDEHASQSKDDLDVKSSDSRISTSLDKVTNYRLLGKFGMKSSNTIVSSSKISSKEQFEILSQLASALKFLHEKSIIHRDIKPENIGFDSKGTVKLFDFGLALELDPSDRLDNDTYDLTGGIGSCRYMAPEVASYEPYNLAADIYSFSLLMYAVLNLSKPFEKLSRKKWAEKVIVQGHRPNLTEVDCVESVKNIIKRGWQTNFHERPTMDEILAELRG